MGIVEGSCGYRARRVSIRGKSVLSRNPGYKTRVCYTHRVGVGVTLKSRVLPRVGGTP